MKDLQLLGVKAIDKVTGFSGVVTSICYDLVGCIQAAITPPADLKEGKIPDGRWFDISRLDIGERVMPCVFNDRGEPAQEKGCCDKPAK